MPVAARPGDPAITPALVAEHGLTAEEYERLVAMLERQPTFTELGIVSALWSEHCSYKHSRPVLRTLPTQAPWVLQGPGENAGVISVGDGLGSRLQDRIAQPPVRRRALPGRRHGRRRHPARRLHDGRASDRAARLAALRAARHRRACATCSPASSRGSATTATASACRPSAAKSCSTHRTRAIRSSTRCASASCARTS